MNALILNVAVRVPSVPPLQHGAAGFHRHTAEELYHRSSVSADGSAEKLSSPLDGSISTKAMIRWEK